MGEITDKSLTINDTWMCPKNGWYLIIALVILVYGHQNTRENENMIINLGKLS